jgi:hypothetical protein
LAHCWKIPSLLITLLRKRISTMQKASTMGYKKLFYGALVGATPLLSNNAPKRDLSTGLGNNDNFLYF